MSTVVYRAVDSLLNSTESKTLNLKLVFSESIENASHQKLISPFHSITSETVCENLEGIYMHPSAVKRASWWLSDESLNLCTENLGSETGSEFIQSSIFSSLESSTTTDQSIYEIRAKREHRRPSGRRQIPEAKRQLPPPLTTLCGSESLDIKSQRENGRLILKAVRTAAPRRSGFLVDRSNGRLRLSLASSNEVFVDDETMTSCSYGSELITEFERIESTTKKYIMEQQQVTRSGSVVASSFCRCNENHKNHAHKITKTNGLMTSSMVKVEPRYLVASS